ncbi:MAG TPA: glutathione S-transferase N-terminal domain-containing protein [Solirubrobacteraceae bacterium]|nr:glutathione S-transferase N-terminal domain-containing protein [Solirubrobacteraceae bacterium]
MDEKLTLYVCSHDDGPPSRHPCRRAQRALSATGHDFEKVIFAKGRPFGLFTSGRRPELKEISGQEQLPVLRLPDGSTVNGGSAIVAWAEANAPAPTAPAAQS